MKRAWYVLIAPAGIWPAAHAQEVPELGRWQEIDFPSSDVIRRTAVQYQDVVLDLASAGRLDDDRAVLKRTRSVLERLMRTAPSFKPEAASWKWEIHPSSDPSIEAFCMAGGKRIVGSRFMRHLRLNDGELATLLGHEIAHALANHPDEVLSNVRRIGPAPGNSSLNIVMSRLDADWTLQLCLSRLLSIQESEADRLGMMLAHRAGWRAADMVSFYQKLAADEHPSALSASHPGAASCLSMAKGMAKFFGDQ